MTSDYQFEIFVKE